MQQKFTQYSKRAIIDLLRLQNIASKWFSLECYLVLTYYCVKDSLSVKAIDIRLRVWFAPSAAQSKLSKTFSYLFVSFHGHICLMRTKGHCSRNRLQNQSAWNVDCVQKPWTMDWYSSVRTDHKILNKEAQNEGWQNFFIREFIGPLLHRDFHTFFPHSKVSRLRRKILLIIMTKNLYSI